MSARIQVLILLVLSGCWRTTGMCGEAAPCSGEQRCGSDGRCRLCGVADQARPGEVLVPCGSFLMGSSPGQGASCVEMPAQQVPVKAFFLDQTEVTVEAYTRCVNSKDPNKCSPPVAHDDSSAARFCNWGKPGQEQHPVNCVSWCQAMAYCAWNHQRLPTEIEWEYAARGPAHSEFPWGEGLDGSQACWNQPDAGTCPVASAHPKTLLGAPNDNGLSDLAGNTWEWVATSFCPYPLSDPTPPAGQPGMPDAACAAATACDWDMACFNKNVAKPYHSLRGGSWRNPASLPPRAAARFSSPIKDSDTDGSQDNNNGFRCARTPRYDPDPP